MALLTLTWPLAPSSSIFAALSKQFCNTLLWLKGIVIDNTVIMATILKTHLKLNEMDHSAATSVLVLMIQLLNALAHLPAATKTNDPGVHASRHIIHLLGHLYQHLLETYMHPSLSLHQQLTHLSAAAHLILALYSREQGDFIPIQLYFDVMSIIRMPISVWPRLNKMIPMANSGFFFREWTAWR